MRIFCFRAHTHANGQAWFQVLAKTIYVWWVLLTGLTKPTLTNTWRSVSYIRMPASWVNRCGQSCEAGMVEHRMFFPFPNLKNILLG